MLDQGATEVPSIMLWTRWVLGRAGRADPAQREGGQVGDTPRG